MRALADAGADLNLADPDGTTPLIPAIVNAKFDTAVALLDKGANPNAVDNMGMSAPYAATDMHTLSPMMGRPAPPMRDSIDAVELARALLKKGANPNLQLKRPIIGRHTSFQGDGQLGEGSTPLARAAKSADAAMIKVLLDGGADPRLTRKDGTTAAMIAVNARGQRVYAAAASVATPATEADALEALKLHSQHAARCQRVECQRGDGSAQRRRPGRGHARQAAAREGRQARRQGQAGPPADRHGARRGWRRRPPRRNAPGQVHESTVAVLSEAMKAKGIAIPPPPARPAGPPAEPAEQQQVAMTAPALKGLGPLGRARVRRAWCRTGGSRRLRSARIHR